MKIDVVHGSEAWHEARRMGLGSSDAPVIMGVSPYRTPYELWQEKTGIVPREQSSNWAMERGNDLEPVARAQYELLYNIDMPPTNLIHPEFDFLRASLDGFNKEFSRVLEIKCPGKEHHKLAIEGEVPVHYYPQLQHQLMVSGAKQAHYYSFDGVQGALVIVERNEPFIETMLKAEREFWDMVQKKVPPPLSNRDYVPIEDGALQNLLRQWRDLNNEASVIDAQIKDIRGMIEAGIKETIKTDRCSFENIKISRQTRKGNVDYAKVPELKGVDLEPYRKPSTESYVFRTSNEEI